MTKGRDVGKLLSVTEKGELICQKIKKLDDYYLQPLKSSFLNTFEGKNDFEKGVSYNISDVKSKVFAVRCSDTSYVFFPLLHSYQEL